MERIDAKAGVVGERNTIRDPREVTGLFGCVPNEGRAIFDTFRNPPTEILEADDLKLLAQSRAPNSCSISTTFPALVVAIRSLILGMVGPLIPAS